MATGHAQTSPPSGPSGHPEFALRLETDPDGKVYACHETKLGWAYRMETASDISKRADPLDPESLDGWTSDGTSIYGSGQEIRTHIYTHPEPGQSPPPVTRDPRPFYFFQISHCRDHAGALISWGQGTQRRSYLSTQNFRTLNTSIYHLDSVYLVEEGRPNRIGIITLGQLHFPATAANIPVLDPADQAIVQILLDARTEIIAKLEEVQANRELLSQQFSSIPVTPGIKKFFRAVAVETDTDADGIPDHTEFEIGTNPYLVDSDGDGLDDGVENSTGSDATNPDSDADGIPDGQDSDPNTALAPAELAYESRTVDYSFDSTGSTTGPITGTLAYDQLWPTIAHSDENVYSPLTISAIKGKLASQYPFGSAPKTDTPRQDAFLSLDATATVDWGAAAASTANGSPAASFVPEPAPATLIFGDKKAWLDRKSAAPYVESKMYLKVERSAQFNSSSNQWDLERMALVELNVPSGQPSSTTSIVLDPLLPTSRANPSTGLRRVFKQSLDRVGLMVDANMNGKLLYNPGGNGVPTIGESIDERYIDLLGNNTYKPLKQTAASLIIRVNNDNDGGPTSPSEIDCGDDKLEKSGLDHAELTASPDFGGDSRNYLAFFGPKLMADQAYVIKLAEGQENLRIFYNTAGSIPVLVDKTRPEAEVNLGHFIGNADPVLGEKLILEGVKAGTSKVELYLRKKASTPHVDTLVDSVTVTVNVDRLPKSNQTAPGSPLTKQGTRNRVYWIKNLDITEINNAVGGPISNGVPIAPPPSPPYPSTAFLMAVRGSMSLHLPALPDPASQKLIPTSTWDTGQKNKSIEMSSYWIGMEDRRDPTKSMWVQGGFLILRGENGGPFIEDFEDQKAFLYLETGVNDNTGIVNLVQKIDFSQNISFWRDDQRALKEGIHIDFILYREAAGAIWKFLVRNRVKGHTEYKILEAPPPHLDDGDRNDVLRNIYHSAKPNKIEVENEFTQSVTAVAGTEKNKFQFKNLQAGLRRKSTVAAPSAANPPTLWAWLDNEFDWEYINTVTGETGIELWNGEVEPAGGSTIPKAIRATHTGANHALSLTIPDTPPVIWPWHVRTLAAGQGSSSIVEFWDDRTWMFPIGTGNKWKPGK